jgi:hypothetical protein
MKIATYFFTSFLVGVMIGNFLLARTGLFLSPVQGTTLEMTQAASTQGFSAPVFEITTEMVVSLMTAALLFASSFVLWRKYKTEQHYFSRGETRWRTL